MGTFIAFFKKSSDKVQVEPKVLGFDDKNSFVWDVKAGLVIKQFTNKKKWFLTCANFIGTPLNKKKTIRKND